MTFGKQEGLWYPSDKLLPIEIRNDLFVKQNLKFLLLGVVYLGLNYRFLIGYQARLWLAHENLFMHFLKKTSRNLGYQRSFNAKIKLFAQQINSKVFMQNEWNSLFFQGFCWTWSGSCRGEFMVHINLLFFILQSFKFLPCQPSIKTISYSVFIVFIFPLL